MNIHNFLQFISLVLSVSEFFSLFFFYHFYSIFYWLSPFLLLLHIYRERQVISLTKDQHTWLKRVQITDGVQEHLFLLIKFSKTIQKIWEKVTLFNSNWYSFLLCHRSIFLVVVQLVAIDRTASNSNSDRSEICDKLKFFWRSWHCSLWSSKNIWILYFLHFFGWFWVWRSNVILLNGKIKKYWFNTHIQTSKEHMWIIMDNTNRQMKTYFLYGRNG